MKSLFVRLINSSNYQENRLVYACLPRIIRGKALGPQDEDVGRSMDKNGEKVYSYMARRFIREFIPSPPSGYEMSA